MVELEKIHTVRIGTFPVIQSGPDAPTSAIPKSLELWRCGLDPHLRFPYTRRFGVILPVGYDRPGWLIVGAMTVAGNELQAGVSIIWFGKAMGYGYWIWTGPRFYEAVAEFPSNLAFGNVHGDFMVKQNIETGSRCSPVEAIQMESAMKVRKVGFGFPEEAYTASASKIQVSKDASSKALDASVILKILTSIIGADEDQLQRSTEQSWLTGWSHSRVMNYYLPAEIGHRCLLRFVWWVILRWSFRRKS